MKLKLVLAVVSLAVCSPLVCSIGESQKHPPSMTQCRSDAADWNREEDVGPKDKDVGYQLSFGELLKRQGEMLDCMTLDAQHGPEGQGVKVRTSYEKITHIYTTAMYSRYQHFLDRHHLVAQFLEEDEKGLR
jgi:hypothetical protein